MTKSSRDRYRIAVANGDVRAQVEALEAVARDALAQGQTLAVPRMIEEALGLVHGKSGVFGRFQKAKLTARLLRLWAKSGIKARQGRDPSKYWFFHT